MIGYNLFLIVYRFGLGIASLFLPKAKLWVEGRKQIWQDISKKEIKGCIWFHAASLGEFEQISYLIQRYRAENPSAIILLTFYSPSGYEVKKNYSYADIVTYLPFDFTRNIDRFLATVQPQMVLWVRYEFWMNMLVEIHRRDIPLYLLNGVFRQSILPFYLPILKKSLAQFSKLYTINLASQVALKKWGYDSEILPDTRYDRMQSVAKEEFLDTIIAHFIENKNVLISGSTWLMDEQIIQGSLTAMDKWIIVPHEVHEDRIVQIVQIFPDSQRYSQYDKNRDSNVLIIDTIGMLSKIYRYATIVYVGGGFDKVVHSLVEPLAYSKPIIIGQNIAKSEEAKAYTQDGIAVQIGNSEEMKNAIQRIMSGNREQDTQRRKEYFDAHTGSTDKIIELLKKNTHF